MVRRMRQQEEAVLRARMEEVKGGFGAADKAPWIPAWDMWPDEHGIRCCVRCACCACCAYALVCVRCICTVCACVCVRLCLCLGGVVTARACLCLDRCFCEGVHVRPTENVSALLCAWLYGAQCTSFTLCCPLLPPLF